jgi:hypothetical protein
MSELRLPSTLDPPTSFCCSEFLETVKLAVIATATGMLTVTITETGTIKQDALYSKKFWWFLPPFFTNNAFLNSTIHDG